MPASIACLNYFQIIFTIITRNYSLFSSVNKINYINTNGLLVIIGIDGKIVFCFRCKKHWFFNQPSKRFPIYFSIYISRKKGLIRNKSIGSSSFPNWHYPFITNISGYKSTHQNKKKGKVN